MLYLLPLCLYCSSGQCFVLFKFCGMVSIFRSDNGDHFLCSYFLTHCGLFSCFLRRDVLTPYRSTPPPPLSSNTPFLDLPNYNNSFSPYTLFFCLSTFFLPLSPPPPPLFPFHTLPFYFIPTPPPLPSPSIFGLNKIFLTVVDVEFFFLFYFFLWCNFFL